MLRNSALTVLHGHVSVMPSVDRIHEDIDVWVCQLTQHKHFIIQVCTGGLRSSNLQFGHSLNLCTIGGSREQASREPPSIGYRITKGSESRQGQNRDGGNPGGNDHLVGSNEALSQEDNSSDHKGHTLKHLSETLRVIHGSRSISPPSPQVKFTLSLFIKWVSSKAFEISTKAWTCIRVVFRYGLKAINYVIVHGRSINAVRISQEILSEVKPD
jgi:hypothetical protein